MQELLIEPGRIADFLISLALLILLTLWICQAGIFALLPPLVVSTFALAMGTGLWLEIIPRYRAGTTVLVKHRWQVPTAASFEVPEGHAF